MIKRFPLYILIVALIMGVASCNSSTSGEDPVLSSSTRIISFRLAKDDSVLVHLDTIFFTVDLEKGLIYNADSLPKGTDVRKLVTSISMDAMSEAYIYVKNGEIMKDETIDFATNYADSIDFTGDVTMKLVSQDGTASKTYSIKVNVHQMNPDSLYWNKVYRTLLPGGSTSMKKQHTVQLNSELVCMQYLGGSDYSVSVSNDITSSTGLQSWDVKRITLAFTPNLDSMTACEDTIYMLDENGAMYQSSDKGLTWSSTGVEYYSLLGAHQNTLLTIINDGGVYKHDIYPRPAGFVPVAVNAEFPISGTSQMIQYKSQWSEKIQSIIFGGVKSNGTLSGDAWGFDGENWSTLSIRSITGRKNAVLLPYLSYKLDENTWQATQYTTWVVIGGQLTDGTYDKTVYTSIDAGLRWSKGADLLQLPDYILSTTNAQAFVIDETLSSTDGRSSGDISWNACPSAQLPAWYVPESAMSRGTTQWDCPYIYLFGGEFDGGTYNVIWKGVINRLSFVPLH